MHVFYIPVTCSVLLVVVCILVALIVHVFQVLVACSVPNVHCAILILLLQNQVIFRGWQLWRLFPASVAFHSLPELLFGLYLIYFFRLFERQLGSNKFSVSRIASLFLTGLRQPSFPVTRQSTSV